MPAPRPCASRLAPALRPILALNAPHNVFKAVRGSAVASRLLPTLRHARSPVLLTARQPGVLHAPLKICATLPPNFDRSERAFNRAKNYRCRWTTYVNYYYDDYVRTIRYILDMYRTVTAAGGASLATVPYVMRILDAYRDTSAGAASHVTTKIRVAVARHGPTSIAVARRQSTGVGARACSRCAPRSRPAPAPAPRTPRATRIDTGRQPPQRPARPAPATRASRCAAARPHRRTAALSHATP